MNLSARDENGKGVDWWFIYKVPKLGSGISDSESASGYEYVYCDSEIDRSGGEIDRSPDVLGDRKGAFSPSIRAVEQILIRARI
jgi:deoxyribonuclease-2